MNESSATTAASPPPLTIPAVHALDGVRGWLLLFVIGQALRALVSLATIQEAFTPFVDGTMTLAFDFPLFFLVIPMEALAHLAQIAMPVIGFILMNRRSPHTRPFWLVYLLSLLAFVVIDSVAGWFVIEQMTEAFGAEHMTESKTALSAAVMENVQVAFYSLIWSLYWLKSVRVAVTYPRE